MRAELKSLFLYLCRAWAAGSGPPRGSKCSGVWRSPLLPPTERGAAHTRDPSSIAVSQDELAEMLPPIRAWPRLVDRRGSPYKAKTLWQVCDLSPSWGDQRIHAQAALAVWILREAQISLQPHGELASPQLQPPVLCSAALLSPTGNGAKPEQVPIAASAGCGLVFLLTHLSWVCLEGQQLAQQSKPREGCYISTLSPTRGKVQRKGDDATWHLLSPHTASELSRGVQGGSGAVAGSGAVSGTLALAEAEGQLGCGDQDGAEDGLVALGQGLGVLRHHFQHQVSHLLGDVAPEIQQGGDVLVAGQRAGGELGCIPQTSHDPEKPS